MKRIGTKNRIVLRSMMITLFMLSCMVVAVVMMGKAYSAMQRDAFGVEVKAFSMVDRDHVTVFGKEIYFPLISIKEKVYELIDRSSPGIIKLLSAIIDLTKELGDILFKR